MQASSLGFRSLSSIDFSGLTSLESVGNMWMEGANGGFSSMTSIIVGDISKSASWSDSYFCNGWPTSGTIYGNSYEAASSWKVGSLSSWSTNPSTVFSSFYTLSSDPSVKHPFTQDDTPIDNFCTQDDTLTINNETISKNDICSLAFGSSYGDVTSIGDDWLYGKEHFSNLKSISFEGFSSLSSVGARWMEGGNYGFSSLTSISFDGLSSLSSVGGYWMEGNTDGFASLQSIDFSGLGNLTNVQKNWMDGGTDSYKGFSSMNSINVGSLAWQSGFSLIYFCNDWPTSGTIYGEQADTWLKGGISSWSTSL